MTQHSECPPSSFTSRGVVALVRLAVLCVDLDGQISHWNRGAEELFGHRWEAVFGRRASGLLPAVTVPIPSRRLPEEARRPAVMPFAHPYRDGLDRLDELTRSMWCGPMSVTDRDGRVRDVLWWTYRLVEPAGRSLLALAVNAKPLRDSGPRIGIGDQLVGYTRAESTLTAELRIKAEFADVSDPVLTERLSCGLGATLPRVSPPRLRRIMRQILPHGFPVLEVEESAPLPVLPYETPDPPAPVAWPRRRRRPPGPGQLEALSHGDKSGAVRPCPSATRRRLDDGQLTLLSEAGARIGTTLDLYTTARELCAVTVPVFADAASVHLVDQLISDREPPRDQHPDEAALLRRVATEQVGLPEALSSLAPEGELLSATAGSPWSRLSETHIFRYVDASLAEDLAAGLGTPSYTPLISGRSLLVVPLMARGTVLGRLVLLRNASRHPFDEREAAMAQELAARGAVSIDNARLHLLESRAAATIQHSMLPTRPPRLPGVRIAHHYRPGDRQAQVGGDWFDATQLPGGRVALIVGDVMGHGLHSAAVMSQFRTAVQTMAALDLPPAQLLRHLDNLAHRLGQDHLASCVYVVYDPIRRVCTLSNAGHVPPVLARADGPSELLRIPEGAPIGVGGVPFETVEIAVPDGSWLVLCTDGLVEVRDEGGIGAGLAALCENVIEPRQTPEEVCEAILSRLHTEDRRDDVALLVARFEGIPAEDVAQWELPLDFEQVRQARALTRKQLIEWGLDQLSDLTELLVSELVTNAVRAATRSVELRLMKVGKLLVEVSDDNHNLPLLVRAEADDEGGRGLALVSNLSTRWGTSRTAVGKVVWFELPLPQGND